MPFLNIEIKARCKDLQAAQQALRLLTPRRIGLDHQIDTYFNVPNGPLKLREGNIEHSLIHYHRSDQKGPKSSHVSLYKPQPGPNLKAVLTAALGIKVIVDKKRDIYFVDNVKLHFDEVKGLGTFLEIEAIDREGDIGKEKLQEQCEQFMEILRVKNEDLVDRSYSDLLLAGK